MNPYVIIAALILWLVSLVAVGKWQRTDGATAASAKCAAEKNVELERERKRAEELTREVREWEGRHAESLYSIGTNFAKEMENAERIRRRDVDAARNGGLVLRVPASVCGGPPGEAFGPPTPAGHGGEARELPRETSADLLSLADDADQVALQLAACQKIIIEDRRN